MFSSKAMWLGAVMLASGTTAAYTQSIPNQSSSALNRAPGGLGPVTLGGVEAGRESNCHGRPLLVTTSKSVFLVRGFCSQLTVRGDSDTIRIELAAGGLVSFLGKNNNVIYQPALNGAPAVVRDPDRNNTVRRVANLDAIPGGPRAGLISPGNGRGQAPSPAD